MINCTRHTPCPSPPARRVYEAVAADVQQHAATRRYCVHLVADFITTAAVALPPQQVRGGRAGCAAAGMCWGAARAPGLLPAHLPCSVRPLLAQT